MPIFYKNITQKHCNFCNYFHTGMTISESQKTGQPVQIT